ncbi:MAG: halocarboxylic acid dehydrogenase DehI family protein [Bacillota bacterium]|nr:halocarboxylic acid dehydrogenase DehI family protein [Bacillota bacterium]
MLDSYAVPEILDENISGSLKELYDDIKCVLKVPMVNFIFRTLALYESFLSLGWSQVRPNMLTENMEECSRTLGNPDMSAVVPKINWQHYYDTAQIMNIRKIVSTFNYANPKLLIIASAWAEALSERPVCGETTVKGELAPGIQPNLLEINLIEYCEAPLSIRGLYEDIARVHGSFDIASDFRALANFPSFLIESWKHLRPYVQSDEYEKLKSDIKKLSVKMSHSMPFPVTVSRDNLKQMYNPKDIAGIMGIVSMFQNFLPGLIIDGEFLRRMLE